MIVEQRTYTTHPGKIGEYFKHYEAEGLAVQKAILGRLVGYYQTELGPLNQIVHMWGYTDLNDRADRRAKLFADPVWKAYLPKILPLLVSMESKILVPAPFFKPEWMA